MHNPTQIASHSATQQDTTRYNTIRHITGQHGNRWLNVIRNSNSLQCCVWDGTLVFQGCNQKSRVSLKAPNLGHGYSYSWLTILKYLTWAVGGFPWCTKRWSWLFILTINDLKVSNVNCWTDMNDDLERVQWRTLSITSPGLSYWLNLERCKLSSLHERRKEQCKKLYAAIVSDPSHKLHKLLPPRHKAKYDLKRTLWLIWSSEHTHGLFQVLIYTSHSQFWKWVICFYILIGFHWLYFSLS